MWVSLPQSEAAARFVAMPSRDTPYSEVTMRWVFSQDEGALMEDIYAADHRASAIVGAS